MTRFRLFLAPKIDFTSESTTSEELIFYELPPVSQEQVESQSQRRQADLRYNAGESSQPRQAVAPDREEEVADEVESWNDSGRLNHIPAKRSRNVLEASDQVPPLPDKSVFTQPVPVNASRALGPRRSTRVSRPSEGHLTVLPGLDGTESFLSLNTTATISQQSQPPLPNWSIPLSKLVTLQSPLSGRALIRRQQNEATKVSLMVCVMAVDTPVRRQRKEEKARGQEGTLWIGGWKVTAPPVDGADGAVAPGAEMGCTVKLWEEMAQDWGEGRIRRGDVVLLENVEYRAPTSKDPATITISRSPNSLIQPKISILFRTLPRRTAARSDYLPPRSTRDKSRNFGRFGEMPPPVARMMAEDEALRPDLRLSRSDAGVRKVAEWARWFANWVGGEPP